MTLEAELPLSAEAIAEVLSLLPLLESGQSLYRMHDVPSLDPYVYSPALFRWLTVVGRGPFPLRFDWPQWLDQAKALDADPALIAQADLPTLRKLLTTYLRTERFTSGTLARIIEHGQLLAILQRLKALNPET